MPGIIEKAKKRDPGALTLLINTYKDNAYNLALSIVKQLEDAKDVIQQSFLLVLENIDKFRNEAKFSTWLYKIVYNESIKWKRKKYSFVSLENIRNLKYDISEIGDINTKKRLLINALQQLKENERVVINLFYLGERSLKEISKITGLSVGNIKILLHRARKKIKTILNHEQLKA